MSFDNKNTTTSKYSVLFVDDEDKARKYFNMALKSDFEIKTASNVDDALHILQDCGKSIAVVVSDQRMPGKSGVELLKAVKDYYPHIVRLLTTAYSDLDDAIEAINRGEVLRYIQKPWNLDTLKSEIQQAMNLFLLKSERDILLKEKLSVRHNMTQIDRITQLVLFSSTIPQLRFTNHAIRNFIEQIINSPLESRQALQQVSYAENMDLWELTVAETQRSQHFIRRVLASIKFQTVELSQAEAALNQMTPDQIIPGQIMSDPIIVEQELKLSSERTSININLNPTDQKTQINNTIFVNLNLFQQLLDKSLSCLSHLNKNSQSISVGLELINSEAKTIVSSLQIKLSLSQVELPSDNLLLLGSVNEEVSDFYVELLIAFFLCFHHEGKLDFHYDDNNFSLILLMPLEIKDSDNSDVSLDWLKRVLIKYEPEPDDI